MKKIFLLIMLLVFAFFQIAYAEEKSCYEKTNTTMVEKVYHEASENISADRDDEVNLKSELGVVEHVYYDVDESQNFENLSSKQIVQVKLLSGEFKGKVVEIDNMITNNPYYDIFLKKGNRVILHAEQKGNEVEYFIADIQRINALYAFLALFIILLFLVGKKKGLLSLLSILIVMGLVFFALAPLMLNGVNPILATVLVCLLASSMAIYIVSGFNSKSTSAVLGTVISLCVAGFLSIMTIKFAHLTGFSGEECLFLYSARPDLNFVGILASAMIIAALGALMDISVSIASTINEIKEQNSKLGVKETFKSGMNVGRDIIGTMANTFILVYLGSSLPLVMLAQNIDTQKFFNLNQVVTEISSALVGSIAMVICVPLTAIISAYLIKNKNSDIIKLEEMKKVEYDND